MYANRYRVRKKEFHINHGRVIKMKSKPKEGKEFLN